VRGCGGGSSPLPPFLWGGRRPPLPAPATPGRRSLRASLAAAREGRQARPGPAWPARGQGGSSPPADPLPSSGVAGAATPGRRPPEGRRRRPRRATARPGLAVSLERGGNRPLLSSTLSHLFSLFLSPEPPLSFFLSRLPLSRFSLSSLFLSHLFLSLNVPSLSLSRLSLSTLSLSENPNFLSLDLPL